MRTLQKAEFGIEHQNEFKKENTPHCDHDFAVDNEILEDYTGCARKLVYFLLPFNLINTRSCTDYNQLSPVTK